MTSVFRKAVRACLWTFCGVILLGMSAATQSAARDVSLVEMIHVAEGTDSLDLTLPLSHPVAYRVFTLDAPRRLVIDLSETSLERVDLSAVIAAEGVDDVRAGRFREGWARIVADLATPLVPSMVEMQTGETPQLRLSLKPVSAIDFAAQSGAPDAARVPIDAIASLADSDDRLILAVDPGHGGIDPGAIRNGVAEKDIALQFAYDLQRALADDAVFRVFLTRKEDRFVSLAHRVRLAQQAGADVFLSIHANTVTEGDASGATIYSLSEEASDAASARLAELENRSDISAGLDLSAEDDDIAKILIDLAQVETNARSQRFATALVEGMGESVGTIRTRPHRSAGFKVLKAPDMPSLLLELGFLSNARDRANMQDPGWRARAVSGVLGALRAWSREDEALADLVMR